MGNTLARGLKERARVWQETEREQTDSSLEEVWFRLPSNDTAAKHNWHDTCRVEEAMQETGTGRRWKRETTSSRGKRVWCDSPAAPTAATERPEAAQRCCLPWRDIAGRKCPQQTAAGGKRNQHFKNVWNWIAFSHEVAISCNAATANVKLNRPWNLNFALLQLDFYHLFLLLLCLT